MRKRLPFENSTAVVGTECPASGLHLALRHPTNRTSKSGVTTVARFDGLRSCLPSADGCVSSFVMV